MKLARIAHDWAGHGHDGSEGGSGGQGNGAAWVRRRLQGQAPVGDSASASASFSTVSYSSGVFVVDSNGPSPGEQGWHAACA
jgi:hypothetical protein